MKKMILLCLCFFSLSLQLAADCCSNNTGPQGIKGPRGICCSAITAFASAYSLTDQTIPPGSAALLELISTTTPDFDLTTTGMNGEIVFLTSGVYLITWGVDGLFTPPIPAPAPPWSFGIFKNGALIGRPTSGSFSISPDDICSHDTGFVIVPFLAGDVMNLVNVSTSTFSAIADPFGTNVPVATARINIAMVQPF